jgi:hypothetical protein
MALIDNVKKICERLASNGWWDLLLKYGLDPHREFCLSMNTVNGLVASLSIMGLIAKTLYEIYKPPACL